LFQDECSDNPDRLGNKTTLGNDLRFIGDNGYLEIEYDGAAAAGL
jgi:hypothetical protein